MESSQAARDRIITKFPESYSQTTTHGKIFDSRVREACLSKKIPNVRPPKVIVIGDVPIDKRFCHEDFRRQFERANIGIDIKEERFNILGVPFVIVLYDTSGPRFKCISPFHYKGADAVVAMFDMADSNTLYNVMSWYENVLLYNRKHDLFLVGNKDLRERTKETDVTAMEEAAMEIADVMQAEYWTVSGWNVEVLFNRVAAITFNSRVLKILDDTDAGSANERKKLRPVDVEGKTLVINEEPKDSLLVLDHSDESQPSTDCSSVSFFSRARRYFEAGKQSLR
ncbi:ras-related protein Rab-34-like [Diadema antillarum]|uniref:ras-related protein Rab-34-like n=1 Tax=Diadema antillarum TaxID=105358 RepID=UPI003A8A5914